MKWRKANWIGHTFHGKCLPNTLLRKKGWECVEEDVSSYWMTLSKRECTGNWKRQHGMALWRTRCKERPLTCRKTTTWWCWGSYNQNTRFVIRWIYIKQIESLSELIVQWCDSYTTVATQSTGLVCISWHLWMVSRYSFKSPWPRAVWSVAVGVYVVVSHKSRDHPSSCQLAERYSQFPARCFTTEYTMLTNIVRWEYDKWLCSQKRHGRNNSSEDREESGESETKGKREGEREREIRVSRFQTLVHFWISKHSWPNTFQTWK